MEEEIADVDFSWSILGKIASNDSFPRASNWPWVDIKIGCRCQVSQMEEKYEICTYASQEDNSKSKQKAIHHQESSFSAPGLGKWPLEWKSESNRFLKQKVSISEEVTSFSDVGMSSRQTCATCTWTSRVRSKCFVHERWTMLLVANGHIINCNRGKKLTQSGRDNKQDFH